MKKGFTALFQIAKIEKRNDLKQRIMLNIESSCESALPELAKREWRRDERG